MIVNNMTCIWHYLQKKMLSWPKLVDYFILSQTKASEAGVLTNSNGTGGWGANKLSFKCVRDSILLF